MARAIGYVRVSTETQATEGVGMETQKVKIEQWAGLNGYNLVAVFDDAGISGTRSDRPGLAAALDGVGKGDALVVYSLSRLARSTRHTIEIGETLSRRGADLVSISEKIDTTTAAGRMVFRMLAVLNEFERDQLSERTSHGLQTKKAKSELVGSVPYGKRLDADGVHLVDDPDEQVVIEVAKQLQGESLSLRKIASRLEELGHLTRTGKRFQAVQVQRLLQ